MRTVILLAVSAIALAACQRSEREDASLNQTLPESELEMPAANAVSIAPPANIVLPPETAVAPPPEIEDEVQMRDDADATGLTARLPEGDALPGQSGNETRPAD